MHKTSLPLSISVFHKRYTCFPALFKLWSPLQNRGSFLRKGKEIKSNKGSCWLETHAVDPMLNSSTRSAAFFYCFFHIDVIKQGKIPIMQPSGLCVAVYTILLPRVVKLQEQDTKRYLVSCVKLRTNLVFQAI